MEEISKFDGKDGTLAYVVINGRVYDVTSIKQWFNGRHYGLTAGKDLTDASVYVTTFPCSNCAKALIQSGIKEIYYLDNYTNEFTLKMLDEAGIEVIEMNSEIYQTPLVDGADRHTDNELDYIDPLIKEIYKYDIGTTSFKENRKKVLDRFPNLIEDENVVFISNINELYKESFLSNSYLNLYSNGNIAIPADNSDELFDMANLDEVLQYSFINRQEAEYSGLMEVNDRSKRHCVVAGLVMEVLYVGISCSVDIWCIDEYSGCF